MTSGPQLKEAVQVECWWRYLTIQLEDYFHAHIQSSKEDGSAGEAHSSLFHKEYLLTYHYHITVKNPWHTDTSLVVRGLSKLFLESLSMLRIYLPPSLPLMSCYELRKAAPNAFTM